MRVLETPEFRRWFLDLRDERAAERIAQRIARLRNGLLGDAKFFEGIGELRIDYGPGYRLYFIRRGHTIIVLPCGCDKSSQSRDIKAAKALAKEV